MVVYSDSEPKLAANLFQLRIELDQPLPHLVTSNYEPLITCGKYFGSLLNIGNHKFFPIAPNHKRSLELRISNLCNYSSTAKLLDYRYGRTLNQCSCDSDRRSSYEKLYSRIDQ